MSAQTAKRRRTQARNNYNHMPPLRRPHYHRHSLETSKRREEQAKIIRTRMAQKAKKKT